MVGIGGINEWLPSIFLFILCFSIIYIFKFFLNIDDRVLWIRVRTEGVSLKVKVLEKINPPTLEENVINDCVAKMDGEVKKIYVKIKIIKILPILKRRCNIYYYKTWKPTEVVRKLY